MADSTVFLQLLQTETLGIALTSIINRRLHGLTPGVKSRFSANCPASLERFHLQQLVLAVLNEESPVGTEALGKCDNTENCANSFGFLRSPNFSHTYLWEFLDGAEIALLQPLWQLGVLSFCAGGLDSGN